MDASSTPAAEQPRNASVGDVDVDVIVLGGGILGLATAWKLSQRNPDLSIRVIEKESRLALHQTGRNSGVLHSGIYYAPGSAKARTCRRGQLEMIDFCRAYDVPGADARQSDRRDLA